MHVCVCMCVLEELGVGGGGGGHVKACVFVCSRGKRALTSC